MKQILLGVMLCTISTVKAQTTTQDYYYVTSGLQDDLTKGKDIKAGYTLIDLDISEEIKFDDNVVRSIKLFSYKKQDKVRAIAVLFSDNRNMARIGCIPAIGSNSVVWNKCDQDFKSLPAEWNYVLNRVFVKLASRKLSD